MTLSSLYFFLNLQGEVSFLCFYYLYSFIKTLIFISSLFFKVRILTHWWSPMFFLAFLIYPQTSPSTDPTLFLCHDNLIKFLNSLFIIMLRPSHIKLENMSVWSFSSYRIIFLDLTCASAFFKTRFIFS
jgi:hypothetical protein